VANNEAVKLAHPSSEYVLFLNDDIIITKPFISNLVKLAETKRQTAGAVGCSLRAIAGDKMQEAGSIVWKDGSAAAFGRNSENLDAPEFNYPRPVDYVSGACLMVRKDVFVTYGGFDGKNFPNYYEDTDLQLHIQHDLHKEVWLAPRAVAVHDEHGSFGADEAVNKMQAAQKLFYEKWKSSLIPKHVENPHRLPEEEKNIEILKASDLRARDPSKARILYLDAELPNPAKGGGFGRSFDNLSMIVELGHRVTVASYTKTSDQWCDWFCRERIQELGIEVYTGAWEEMVLERIGFYQIVIISRPTIFRLTHLFFRNMMQKSPFSVIYDSEALWYRRDADLLRLYKGGIDFPSMENEQITIEEKELITKIDQSNEIKLLGLADVVITVSNGEKAIASELNPKASIETIGHIMSEENEAKSRTGFRERAGILFVASFDDKMYYNGDAIWYFLKEIYPSVLERSPSIKLTVAGRNIPQYLRTFVKVQGLDRDVTFMESPEDLHQLFDSHRVFIAPHLYGSGIQFKVCPRICSLDERHLYCLVLTF
jgi:glycosyltransferase involved in cell wall biosynthesis